MAATSNSSSANKTHWLTATLEREISLVFRARSELINPIAFFIIVISLFVLGLGPDKATLNAVGPSILWVAALLACLLSTEHLFRADYEDGSLEQLLLSPQSAHVSICIKIFVHWLATGLPLALIAPLLCLMLHLPAAATGAVFFSLLAGTAFLSLLGAIGAALVVGLKKGGTLIALLILPLYIPLLLFGSGCIQAALGNQPYAAYLALIAAMLLVAIALAPLAIVAALKVSVCD